MSSRLSEHWLLTLMVIQPEPFSKQKKVFFFESVCRRYKGWKARGYYITFHYYLMEFDEKVGSTDYKPDFKLLIKLNRNWYGGGGEGGAYGVMKPDNQLKTTIIPNRILQTPAFADLCLAIPFPVHTRTRKIWLFSSVYFSYPKDK